MVYGRNPRLPVDLVFPTQVQFQVELVPERFVLEKEGAMKKVFEFVALAREGKIKRQKFFQDRKLRGKNIQSSRSCLYQNRSGGRISTEISLQTQIRRTRTQSETATDDEITKSGSQVTIVTNFIVFLRFSLLFYVYFTVFTFF